MSKLPQYLTDPTALQRERAAAAKSPLYWCSPTVTVWAYTRMSRAEQDEVNAACRKLEQEKKQANS